MEKLNRSTILNGLRIRVQSRKWFEKNKFFDTGIANDLKLAAVLYLSNFEDVKPVFMTMQVFDFFGIRIEEAVRRALRNTEEKDDYFIIGFVPGKGEFSGLYLISNGRMEYGASILLFPEKIAELVSSIDDLKEAEKLYVIPSSIHEVFVTPIREEIKPEDLKGIISAVNRNRKIADNCEVLSDDIYVYDVGSKRIDILEVES